MTRCPKVQVSNRALNHYHLAYDYRPANATSGTCSPCGSSGTAPDVRGQLPSLELIRYHNYDLIGHEPSSFGPGVFLNYDIRASISESTPGLKSLDLATPGDSTRTLYDGDSANGDPHDGIYIDGSDYIYEARLLDSSGALTTDLVAARRVELRNYHRDLFQFDVLQPVYYSPSAYWHCRLTRIENHNGYGISFAYKQWTQEEIEQSPSRRFQINSVTDAYGRTATFTYLSTQVSGRWVVSRIDLPGAVALEYVYSDKLIQVTHPDQTTSTFTYATNWDADADVITYKDPSAGGVHRNKDVYFEVGNSPIFTSSVGKVRMVVGGTGEVTYYSQDDLVDGEDATWIYEGTNRLKLFRRDTTGL